MQPLGFDPTQPILQDLQRLLSHAVQVATACAASLRAELALAAERPGLSALQQIINVAWSRWTSDLGATEMDLMSREFSCKGLGNVTKWISIE